MKNKIFALILSLLIMMPVNLAETEVAIPTEPQEQETVQEVATEGDIKPDTLDEDITPSAEKPVQNDTFKHPVSKRKIAKKFLLAMFGVAISSFLIFFLLTLYNKIRGRFVDNVKTPKGEVSLKTPETMDDAIKLFLDKTKW